MWNKIIKASILKKIYFKEFNFLYRKYMFFKREDMIHNILVFMYADSFLDIDRSIITYRLDEDRHQELDNEKRIMHSLNRVNVYTKIFRNIKNIKNKSDEYKRLLHEKIYEYINREITIGNYLINRYNLQDYIKNYIHDMKKIDVELSVNFDNGKLIFEDKNIL